MFTLALACRHTVKVGSICCLAHSEVPLEIFAVSKAKGVHIWYQNRDKIVSQ